MILFNSVEANDWHLTGLAKLLKTEMSLGLDRDFIVFVPFVMGHLALVAIFSTTRSLESACNAEWAAFWIFRWD